MYCTYFSHAVSFYSQSSFFIGGTQNLNAPIVIDRYNCYGSEANLADCTAYDYATYDPTCAYAGGVICEGKSIIAHLCIHTKLEE